MTEKIVHEDLGTVDPAGDIVNDAGKMGSDEPTVNENFEFSIQATTEPKEVEGEQPEHHRWKVMSTHDDEKAHLNTAMKPRLSDNSLGGFVRGGVAIDAKEVIDHPSKLAHATRRRNRRLTVVESGVKKA